MKLFFISILSLILPLLYGQQPTSPSTDYHQIITALEQQIRQGKKKALRDIGTLLDKPAVADSIRAILRANCLFSKEAFDLNLSFGKAAFLQFYYNNTYQLHFDELIDAFTISAPEDHDYHQLVFKPAYDTPESFRKISLKMEQALQSSDWAALQQLVQQLKYIKEESQLLALQHLTAHEQLANMPAGARRAFNFHVASLYRFSQQEKAVALLVEMTDKEMLDTATCRRFLVDVTNSNADSVAFPQLQVYYKNRIDSVGSFEAMRYSGYREYFDFEPAFFAHEVDYLGKMLSQAHDYPWIIHNILQDLKTIAHPRALYYVSAQQYKYRPGKPLPKHIDRKLFLGWMNAITDTKTAEAAHKDKAAFCKDYFLYWAKHYNDFIWDDAYRKFIPKELDLYKKESYDKLFRRLNAKNDSVALAAYIKLAQGEAIEIKRLTKKYKQIIKRHNNVLPELKYEFLPVLCELSQYCKENDIRYLADEKSQHLYDLLLENPDNKKRFRLENEVIVRSGLASITILEFMALIHKKNTAANYSFSRILDKLYSIKLPKILRDPQQLRLYLKKSALFKKIGIKGTCTQYHKKLHAGSSKLQALISAIIKSETDEDIIQEANDILKQENSFADSDFQTFLKSPQLFREVQIKKLKQTKQHKLIFNAIAKNENPKAIRALFTYLGWHPEIGLTPLIFKSIEEGQVQYYSDNKKIVLSHSALLLLENIHGQLFNIRNKDKALKAWQEKWITDGDHYKNWGKTFYETAKATLANEESLTVEVINAVTTSPHFQEADLLLCLKGLSKLGSLKKLRYLDLSLSLQVAPHLDYFRMPEFSLKALERVPHFFELRSNEAVMLDFLVARAKNFTIEEQAVFYNKLLNSIWLQQYITALQTPTEHTQLIKAVLSEYLDNSDYITESEEKATLVHIYLLKFIGQPATTSLKILDTIVLEPVIRKAIVKQVITGVSYDELGAVVRSLCDRANPGATDFQFLYTDFGIPIHNFNEHKTLQAFLANHSSMEPVKFYAHYLEDYGVNFKTRGKTDFNKIYQLLSSDNIIPFCGNGPRRDLYIYGLIKFLEHHFDTRLGFHEKLNENQSFFSFTSQQRSMAWQHFLKEKGLVDDLQHKVPSFNQEIARY